MAYIGSTDYFLEVERGNVAGEDMIGVIGNNPDIDTTSTPEDIWYGGGLYTGFIDSADTFDIVSTSSADTFAGTGAQLVFVDGLDANHIIQTEILALSGTSPVTTVNTYIRTRLTRIIQTGSGNVNVGDITITSTTSGAVMDFMPIAKCLTLNGCFTVPAGKNWHALQYKSWINDSNANNAVMQLLVRLQDGTEMVEIEHGIRTDAPFTLDIQNRFVIPEKTDFILRCIDVGNNNANIGAMAFFVETDNA